MENNKLIADFMSWPIHEGFSYITPFSQCYLSTGAGICETTIFRFEELLFNKSWDWIIPVVKKIHVVEQPHLFDNEAIDVIDDVDEALSHLNLDDIYKAIVEFIKWYNKKEH